MARRSRRTADPEVIPATGQQLAPVGNKAMTDIDAQIAARVAGIKDRITSPSTPRISTADRTFTMPDGSNYPAIRVIIVDSIWKNEFYKEAYDPNSKGNSPPVCFAISHEPVY